MEKKEKATRKLERLKDEYQTKYQEVRSQKENLEIALRRTSPGWHQSSKESNIPPYLSNLDGARNQPLQLFSMKGPINTLESAAESIALDCHTHFVPADDLDSSMLNKLALEAYNKVLAIHNKGKNSSTGTNMERKILDGVGKIVKEFEQKRLGSNGRQLI